MIQFTLSFRSSETLFAQIQGQIRRAIASGALKPGERLPPIRDLAQKLLINPNTVARAYRELEQEGLLKNRVGRGSFVASLSPETIHKLRKTLAEAMVRDFLRTMDELGLSRAQMIALIQEVQENDGGS